MGNSFVTDMTNDSFFIILNLFKAKNRYSAKISLVDIKENVYYKMLGKFHCHWYENKGVVGIQMFVTDITRKNLVLKKKSIGLNLSLNHILKNSIVPENFKKSIEFYFKRL